MMTLAAMADICSITKSTLPWMDDIQLWRKTCNSDLFWDHLVGSW